MIIPARKKYPHLSEGSDGVSYLACFWSARYERCKVARELKKIENALRNFRLGYADHYAEERRQHKFLYDVYTNFIRDLHSKHDKLEEKVKRRLAQMDDLLEKFKSLPYGSKLVLSSLD